MNYGFALSAALIAAIGLTGCDSRNNTRDDAEVRSGTTAAAPVVEDAAPAVTATHEMNHNNNATTTTTTTKVKATQPVTTDAAQSGTTSEPTDDVKMSYSQKNLPGAMSAPDRNLRYGLIGNGTGMGIEDTTSKFMTDNYTVSDPTLGSRSWVTSGALSAPTDDQDALKDIKSGTSFDGDYYDISE